MHFEWLLDVRHGADCFRRWHREKEHSGGLMVHKSSHHFDLVNWWLGARPEEVFGYGRLGFYGREAGAQRLPPGLRARPRLVRRRGRPFALDLSGNDALRSLYLDAEGRTATTGTATSSGTTSPSRTTWPSWCATTPAPP
ncbi:Gfo/Idh/MocA family oxidoreductase [Streptomyces sp. M19]